MYDVCCSFSFCVGEKSVWEALALVECARFSVGIVWSVFVCVAAVGAFNLFVKNGLYACVLCLCLFRLTALHTKQWCQR